MSTRIMFRRCQHCGHRYTYNPSTGNLGMICPKCNKAQSSVIDLPKTPLEGVLKNKVKDWALKTFDSLFIHSQEPAIGSVLYCNLAVALEHTGIYVGDGKIVHLNGNGIIESVSFEEFVKRLEGCNPSVSIFCAVDAKGNSIGNELVAERALEMVGNRKEYNLLMDNCHCFTAYCLTGTKVKFGSFALVQNILRSKYGLANWRAINMS